MFKVQNIQLSIHIHQIKHKYTDIHLHLKRQPLEAPFYFYWNILYAKDSLNIYISKEKGKEQGTAQELYEWFFKYLIKVRKKQKSKAQAKY
mgnify:CR=1 FL=1